MSNGDTVRKAVIAASVILTLIGMGLSIGAVLTPSWQVVNLREYNSIHEHGLWLDCTRHTRDGAVLLRRYATITEPLHCVYKFDYDRYSGTFDLEDDNSPVGEVNRHKFYGWHAATLILLGLALLTSFISILLGGCGCRYPALSLLFCGATLLTTFLSSIAEGLFFFFSHRADNRFIKGIVGTYEQRVGLAFFLQMGACFFHFIAFLAAMLATYFAFTGKGIELERDERFSMPTSSKTNMTNVGRWANAHDDGGTGGATREEDLGAFGTATPGTPGGASTPLINGGGGGSTGSLLRRERYQKRNNGQKSGAQTPTIPGPGSGDRAPLLLTLREPDRGDGGGPQTTFGSRPGSRLSQAGTNGTGIGMVPGAGGGGIPAGWNYDRVPNQVSQDCSSSLTTTFGVEPYRPAMPGTPYQHRGPDSISQVLMATTESPGGVQPPYMTRKQQETTTTVFHQTHNTTSYF